MIRMTKKEIARMAVAALLSCTAQAAQPTQNSTSWSTAQKVGVGALVGSALYVTYRNCASLLRLEHTVDAQAQSITAQKELITTLETKNNELTKATNELATALTKHQKALELINDHGINVTALFEGAENIRKRDGLFQRCKDRFPSVNWNEKHRETFLQSCKKKYSHIETSWEDLYEQINRDEESTNTKLRGYLRTTQKDLYNVLYADDKADSDNDENKDNS